LTFLSSSDWQIPVGLACGAAVGAAGLWLLLHKRRTAEEIERDRRLFLVQSGRLVDGMALDVCEVEAEDGRTLSMLIYNYRIGGVDYECSQDLTCIQGAADAAQVRAGFPCTVRYQPGNPQNSIVVAENWTGLRVGLPVFHAYEDPEPIDTSHLDSLRPGRG
jgi:hypothetical protein